MFPPLSSPEHPETHRFVSVVLIVLAIFLGVKTYQAVRQTSEIGKPQPFEHQISITGTAKVKQAPNIATVSLGVQSKGADVATAQNTNTGIVNALIDKVKALNINEEDIQTSQYNVYEEKRWDAEKKASVSNGWIVSQTVTVKIRNTKQVGNVLEVAGKNGATNISGPDFTVDDSTAAKDVARVEAIADAKKQADALKETLGIELMEIVSYNEWLDTGNNYPIAYAKSEMGGGGAPNIQPGTVDGTMTVTISYRLPY